ncbi:MAG: nuclear transport factor 2 family protein [Polyangiaceae bacterium]|jgi:ketosteroid isomerase-like protein|nr:nuclear transport factor 2 family protein [Polyangiaceae bacterium]
MDNLEEQLRGAFAILNEKQGAGLDALLALYHDEVYFEDPLQRVHGKAAFGAAMKRMYRKLKQIEFQLQSCSMDASKDEGHATWIMHFRPRFGPAMVIEGASHFRLRDGQILYHRDYWDLLSSLIETSPLAALAYRSLSKHLA